MSDNWITDRPPTEADADTDGDVFGQAVPGTGRGFHIQWNRLKDGTPWRRTKYWTPPAQAAEAPAPQQPATEIPESIRTGAAPFYVLVVSDDNPRGPGGEPIVWEHPFPRETTLQAALKRRDSIGNRYGTTYIAECRIIPELTREVPSDAG